MSEYFSEEEDKAILRRNSKVKRKPRGMSNKMINKQKKLKKGKNHPEKTTADGQPTEIKITTFICPICYKELTTRSSKKFKRECLKTHILAEHTDSDLKFVDEMFPLKNKPSAKGVHATKGGICPHCGEYKHQLLQHIQYVHATEKIFKCDQCDYAHASLHGLNGHKKYNHPTENDLKVCHICGYKNPSQYNVKKHIQQVHEGQRNHPCNICGHRFVSKHRMDVHVRSIHLGEKNYKCKVCAEAFKWALELNEHRKKIHEGVKYECDQCNKEFRGNKELKRHILNIHEGIRFNCDLCSKQFSSEADVRRHKNKTHSIDTVNDLAHTSSWKRFPHPDPLETSTGNTQTGNAITGNAPTGRVNSNSELWRYK